MIKINVSPKAIADMEQIKRYITEELSSKAAATKLLSDVYHQIERLQDFPLMGVPLFGKSDYMRILFEEQLS